MADARQTQRVVEVLSGPSPTGPVLTQVVVEVLSGPAPAPAPGLAVTIDGIAQRILHESLSIQATINGRDRLSATLPMPTVAPDVRQEIVATFDGVRIFGGLLDTVTQRAGSSWTDRDDQLHFEITAADFNTLADWRLVNGPRPQETLKDYLTDLVPFLPGVTLDPAQVDGPLLPTRNQVFQTVTQVLDEAATITGYVWNIDYDRVLSMWLPSTEAAPFDILDSNAYAIGDITVEPIATGYATSVWLLAGDNSQQIITDTFIGDGATLTFPLKHRAVTHAGTLTVNGVPANVGPGEAWELDAEPTPLVYTLRKAIGGAPAVGAVIAFPYTAQYPLVFHKVDAAAVTAIGYHIEQLFTEPTVFDPAQAEALADGYLAQVTQETQEIRYATLRGDIQPGQTQTITIASRDLSGSFVITDVETRMRDPLLVRHVTARQPGPYAGNWRDVYKLWAQGQTAGATAPGSGVIPPTPGGGGGAPDAHHPTHEPGGTDAMAVDAAAATGSLRTLGPGPNQAAPGDDARFSALAGTYTVVDSTATGTIHNWAPGLVGHTLITWHGATDLAVTGLAGGTSGQIVTVKNTGPTVVTFAHLSGASASTNLFVNLATSAITPVASGGSIAYQYDGLYWRLIAHEQGAWLTAPFSAANFTGNAGTWTVDASDVLALPYRLSGRTLQVSIVINNAATSGTGYLKIGSGAYGGFTPRNYFIAPTAVFGDGASIVPGYLEADLSAAFLIVARVSGAMVGGASSVHGQLTFEVN